MPLVLYQTVAHRRVQYIYQKEILSLRMESDTDYVLFRKIYEGGKRRFEVSHRQEFDWAQIPASVDEQNS